MYGGELFMIGKYIKRLWKDWPIKETKIRAEDLNKYEDALKEHDDRLAELADIDKKVKDNKDAIQRLQNMSQASEYANNSVMVTGEEKIIGMFFSYHICQKAYQIADREMKRDGSIVLTDAIFTDDYHERHLLDVKCSIRSGMNREYSIPGNGYGVITHFYDPVLHALEIHYKNMSDGPKMINIIVQYLRCTA